MVRFRGRPRRRRTPLLPMLVGALLVVGSLIVPTVAGAQDTPPLRAPAYCSVLGDVLDNAFQLPIDDEDYQQQQAEGARLLTELRASAPAELTDELDALEAFGTAAAAEIAAAGGIAGLSDAQRDDLIDRSFAVLEPIETFQLQSCPGVGVEALLYPECEIDGELSPPMLEVDNSSDEPVEVVAGDIVFTVDDLDYGSREVPADLQADDVLIDGVAGLVEVGSCDDFEGGLGFDFADIFTVTFVTGCPDTSPPVLPRLTIDLTAEGLASLGEDLGAGLEVFPVPFEIDDYFVLAKFPGGFNLLLDADAQVPMVSLLDTELTVTVVETDCASVDSKPSDPGQPGPQVGGAVAKPLAPKFTG